MVKKVSIIALAALLLGGCQPPRVRPSLTAQGQTEFQHDVHLALKGEDGKPVSLFCDACHAVQPKDGYAVLRPGSAQHAPCNTCHADEYKKPPGPFCGVCHESVNPKAKGDSPLLPYPGSQRGAQLVSRFDHAVHLDASSKKTALECGACHVVESETSPYMGFPRHQACAGCHAKEDGERAQPEMSECGRCHDRESPVRPKNFLENDIRFTHAKHKVDRSGAEIMCTTCHAAVTQSASEASLQLPEMKDCANCHEDAARTPDEVRIEKCQVCHLDHVDAVVRPGSHTAQLPVAGWGDEGMLARLAPALLLPSIAGSP
ncbi:MAG: hypothetical protein H6730_15385 [Deltaproteobacteria bacterium]|nr:hypothetical protein [Deltaproteobacteria bacterium]